MIGDNGNKKLVDPVKVCNELFGEFNEFHDFFMDIKFGSLPTSTHPSPSAISKIRILQGWPQNYRMLRNMSSICHVCANRGILRHCKCSLKAMAGECEGLFLEATKEDSRLRAKILEQQKKEQG